MINRFHILYHVNPKCDSNMQRWVNCKCAPPVSPSSPEHLPTTPVEIPSQRYEARIEEGKLYYDKRWSVPTAFILAAKCCFIVSFDVTWLCPAGLPVLYNIYWPLDGPIGILMMPVENNCVHFSDLSAWWILLFGRSWEVLRKLTWSLFVSKMSPDHIRSEEGSVCTLSGYNHL